MGPRLSSDTGWVTLTIPRSLRPGSAVWKVVEKQLSPVCTHPPCTQADTAPCRTRCRHSPRPGAWGPARAAESRRTDKKGEGEGPPHTGGGTWMLQTGPCPAPPARRRPGRGHPRPAGGGDNLLGTAAPRPLSAGNDCGSAVSSTDTPQADPRLPKEPTSPPDLATLLPLTVPATREQDLV